MSQYDIFPAQLLAESIRDSGYKTTAHALAELIDNSVQAEANVIEVFCIEEQQLVEQRRRHRVVELAVLDNGTGMDPETLRIALMFGNGRHLQDRSGIGRFGMGLPNSSLSQCQRVNVWSWQAGPDNSLYSYLDIRDIKDGAMREVPDPQPKPVPDRWRELAERPLGESGTLVVWEDLDRVNWRGAQSTLKNTELLVGRMYRKMIHHDGLRIRLVAAREAIEWEMDVRVNDPLFLMAPSSTPAPFDEKPMFRPWGEGKQNITVELKDGSRHTITIRYSYATEEAMWTESGQAPGHYAYGKHARRNRGVSVIRARRELDLDTTWNRGEVYRDRWWGIEVEFPPALDEVFGVTNNKQAATHFAELAELCSDNERQEEWQEHREVWREEGDPRFHLMDVAQHIAEQRNLMRTCLRKMRKGADKRQREIRHLAPKVEDRASEKIKERQKEAPAEIVDEPTTPEANYRTVFDELTTTGGMTTSDAREIAHAVMTRDRKVIFVETDEDSNAFFSPKALPGVHEVRLNLNHPAYRSLIEALDSDIEEEDVGELAIRLRKASDTLKLLLLAWSRFELEARDRTSRRRQIADHRREWGKMATIFIDEELED